MSLLTLMVSSLQKYLDFRNPCEAFPWWPCENALSSIRGADCWLGCVNEKDNSRHQTWKRSIIPKLCALTDAHCVGHRNDCDWLHCTWHRQRIHSRGDLGLQIFERRRGWRRGNGKMSSQSDVDRAHIEIGPYVLLGRLLYLFASNICK